MRSSLVRTIDFDGDREITAWFTINDWAIGPRFCTYSNFITLSLTLGPIGITFTQWRLV